MFLMKFILILPMQGTECRVFGYEERVVVYDYTDIPTGWGVKLVVVVSRPHKATCRLEVAKPKQSEIKALTTLGDVKGWQGGREYGSDILLKNIKCNAFIIRIFIIISH